MTTGDEVILSRVNHPDFLGKQGVVKRIFKSGARKGFVEVILSDGTTYDAKLENIDALATLRQEGEGE